MKFQTKNLINSLRKGSAAIAVALLLTTGALAAEQTVTPVSLEQWNQQGRRFVLVDVRSEAAYNAAHLPGAINVPMALLPHKNLPKDVDLVVYDSDLSGLTSREAAATLTKSGYTRVFALQGGLKAWEASDDRVAVREAGNFDLTLERTISVADFKEAQRIGIPMVVVDLRDQKSFTKSAIPEAVNVPLLKPTSEAATVKTDVLAHAVQLPASAKSRLKSTADEANTQLVAEILAQAVVDGASSKMKSLKSTNSAPLPVVLVDDGGGLAARLVPQLPSAGLQNAYVLENGIIGWTNAKSALVPGTETIEHSATSTTPRKKQ